MTIKPRKRISSNEDLQIAKKEALRPRTHKVSIHVPMEDFKRMKVLAVKEEITITELFSKMMREYLNDR
jgi:hypothetical protein